MENNVNSNRETLISNASADGLAEDISLRLGTVFVEAKLREDIVELQDIANVQQDLENVLSHSYCTFMVGDDLLRDKTTAGLLLGDFYSHCDIFRALKVTDYIGQNSGIACRSFKEVHVKVMVYRLYDTREQMDSLEQAEITSMPHTNFDDRWDDLIFEEDLKGDLMRMMTNLLRFSRRSGKTADMNPIILLYGDPGTGKTTLCQGLAQKISIRTTYTQTKLIQIRTATLLSKFYSESAKQVDNILAAIEQMCKDDSEQFVCVLIDEVESIASSRESSMHGEAQDSLRATNALLTGLDRAKKYPNIIFLCTSNMYDCLDAAFLDRCGLKIAVDPPPLSIQYEIMRGRISALISAGTIVSEETIPCFRDALLEFDSSNLNNYGSKLVKIVNLLQKCGSISGRTLTQLPEQSILRYLGEEDCDLTMALAFLERSVLQIAQCMPMSSSPQKRKAGEDDDIEHVLDVIERFVSSFRGKRSKE